MGKYINNYKGMAMGVTFNEKCQTLELVGAIPVNGSTWRHNLVRVVNNGPFAAAAWAYDQKEWESFRIPDGRDRQWYIVPDVENYAE